MLLRKKKQKLKENQFLGTNKLRKPGESQCFGAKGLENLKKINVFARPRIPTHSRAFLAILFPFFPNSGSYRVLVG